MVTGLQLALSAEAALSLLLGAVVVWRGLDRAVARVLGLLLVSWGAVMLLMLPEVDGGFVGWTWRLGELADGVLTTLMLYLMSVYPPGSRSRARRWLRRVAPVPLLAAAGGAIFDYYPALGDGIGAFLYLIVADLFSPIAIFLPPLWFLVHAYRAPDGPLRAQHAGAGAALLIWVMNDGWSIMYSAWTNDLSWQANVYLASYVWMITGGVLVTLVLVALFIVQAYLGRRSHAGATTITIWAVFGWALAQLQALAPTGAGLLVHLAIDMLAFLLLVYVVARHQLVDVALARPSFTTRGVALAVGLTALIATQVMLEETVGAAYGWLGAILAGLAVTATIPLQQRLERARSGFEQPGDRYEAFRRMRVYEAAVAGALQDGQLDAGDNRSLANLRAALGLDHADHERLMADLTRAA